MNRGIMRWVLGLSVLALLAVGCEKESEELKSTEAEEKSGSEDPSPTVQDSPEKPNTAVEPKATPPTPTVRPPTDPIENKVRVEEDPRFVDQHVLPKEREPETETTKAQRIIRQLTNYLLAEQQAGYPTTQEEAQTRLLENRKLKWPKDPWGEPYVYEMGESAFVIFSAGPDNTPKTDDDIVVEN